MKICSTNAASLCPCLTLIGGEGPGCQNALPVVIYGLENATLKRHSQSFSQYNYTDLKRRSDMLLGFSLVLFRKEC